LQLLKQRQHSTVSTSSTSSSSLATGLTANKIQRNLNSPNTLISNNIIEPILPKTFSSNQTQTNMLSKKVKIVINNLNVYAQQSDKGLCVLTTLDDLEMENHKSVFKKSEIGEFMSSNKNDEIKSEKCELLICFKASEDAQSNKNNIAEIVISNFQFEVNIPTLVGLVELIDDEDFYEPEKLSLPVNISLTNCKFSLNDNPGELNKPIHLSINKLLVNKLPNSEIVISEVSLAPNYQLKKFLDMTTVGKSSLKQLNKLRRKSLTKEIEYDNQFKSFKKESILSFSYKSIHDNTNSDQFASLVYMLRQIKEENRKLRLELQSERDEAARKKETLNVKPVSHDEQKQKTCPSQRNHVVTNDFIVTDKAEKDNDKEAALEKFALERMQFESLLKKYQEENEILRIKLEKSEKNFQQINLERDILVKKLNSKIK
jgi:hypothetical protein